MAMKPCAQVKWPILKTNTSFSLVADKDMSSLQTNVNLVMRVI